MQPERAHGFAASAIRMLAFLPKIVHRFTSPAKKLAVHTLGTTFPSPFGLAAGFDKNATMLDGLTVLGFGHIEVGTLTRYKQPGNAKPRLFRLPEERALINRMGFNNDGAAKAVPRLEAARMKREKRCAGGRPDVIFGVNIGKSRATPVSAAVADYVHSARLLAPLADYIAVNVSSPNTPGLRALQEVEQLAPLITAIKLAAGDTPVLVKIAPDMSDEQLTQIAGLAVRTGVAGIIATNTTVSRLPLTNPVARQDAAAAGEGGLSGAPLKERSLEVLRIIRAAVPERMCIISVGGVQNAGDVLARLRAGATLVQGYTEFIYQGPFWAWRINRQLARAFN